MSNTERQRRFRERHPHYYRDLHRRRKARIDALLAEQRAAQASALKPTPALPATVPGLAIQLPLFADRELEPVAAPGPTLHEQADRAVYHEQPK